MLTFLCNRFVCIFFDEIEDSESSDEDSEEGSEEGKAAKAPNVTRAPELVDVDIALSAFANARKYQKNWRKKKR